MGESGQRAYVVQRCPNAWHYKRKIRDPRAQGALGAKTICIALVGNPNGSRAEKARFASAYARIHSDVEARLDAAAKGPRALTDDERLGVAGVWAATTQPATLDPVGSEEAACIFQALQSLGLVLEPPIGGDWQAPAHPDLVKVAQRLAGLLDGLEHPGTSGWIDSGLIHAEDLNPADAQAWLTSTVQATARGLEHWITQAKTQLKTLGLAVTPDQTQAVAMRLATVGTRIAERHKQVAAGEIAPSLVFPNPPAPMTGTRLQDCLQRWEMLRQPTSKTVLDAAARLAELADLVGSDRLGDLQPSHVSAWKSELLASKTISTVKRRLGLIRAVLSTAHADGLGANPGVLERLNTSTLGGKGGGTTVERKHFSNDQAKHLITLSRDINSPHILDRWAFPLGLSLGCRLEELAGLRHQDICQIDGFWVVVIEPHQDRRLKNSGSARNIPIPDALIAEGFIDWAQAQPDGLLFPDRKPPQSDPRLGHYASKRLGTILRTTMAITDPSLVFHSCRHTVGQSLTDAGVEQRCIESIQGHASRGMTARYSKGGIPLHLLAAAQATRDWSWWSDR